MKNHVYLLFIQVLIESVGFPQTIYIICPYKAPLAGLFELKSKFLIQIAF